VPVPPRPHLSPEAEREDRDDRERLRHLESRLDSLFERRQELIEESRRIAAEQRSLYDQSQSPGEEVERLHAEHQALGHRLAELRTAREEARRKVEEAVVARRELLLTFDKGERTSPEQIRREIAELEHQQQTRALPIDEENALIARLRKRSQDLKSAEARTALVLEHDRLRHEADLAVTTAHDEVDRLGREMTAARTARDQKMGEIREKLQSAGGVVAEMRSRGRARAEVVERIDAISREIAEVEREGRELLARSRARRDEARKTMRAFAGPRGRSTDEMLTSNAEAQFEELMKRGKVTLG
jgi:uncharacterized coiled-coil DUF342 family protein